MKKCPFFTTDMTYLYEREVTQAELCQLTPENAAPIACLWARRRLLCTAVTGRERAVLQNFTAIYTLSVEMEKGTSFASLFLVQPALFTGLQKACFAVGTLSLLKFCPVIENAFQKSRSLIATLKKTDKEYTAFYLANNWTSDLDVAFAKACLACHAKDKAVAYYRRHKSRFGHKENE